TNQATIAGAKGALLSTAITAPIVLLSARKFEWVRKNIKPTGRAILVCFPAVGTFFVVADKSILKSARDTSLARIQN
ncbi:hypothetical protein SELMODRAFT_19325, partial [Selaginella moellendorffii]